LDNLKKIIVAQDYPHHLLEWIIIDDSPQSNQDLFPEATLDGIIIRYYYFHQKVPLAVKRNHLNRQAHGKYIVNIDDDDYYPPCRVSHAVSKLIETESAIVGSSKMFMYFTSNKTIYQLGPYNINHATAATMAYTKEYTKTHNFGTGNFSEEAEFTDSWKTPLSQLDSMKTILAMSHSNNTIDKNIFLSSKCGQLGRTIIETNLILDDFIACRKISHFYTSLPYLKQEENPEVVAKLEKTMNDNAELYQRHMVCRMHDEIRLSVHD
jgi:glycosyltransferase involved in cell wall biosynthesis